MKKKTHCIYIHLSYLEKSRQPTTQKREKRGINERKISPKKGINMTHNCDILRGFFLLFLPHFSRFCVVVADFFSWYDIYTHICITYEYHLKAAINPMPAIDVGTVGNQLPGNFQQAEPRGICQRRALVDPGVEVGGVVPGAAEYLPDKVRLVSAQGRVDWITLLCTRNKQV